MQKATDGVARIRHKPGRQQPLRSQGRHRIDGAAHTRQQVTPQPTPQRTSWSVGRGLLFGAIVLLGCLALGQYAVALNHRFYRQAEPFFDSMSYHESVHQFMTLSRHQGMLVAIGHAGTSSTVFMPQLIAALVGPWLTPSRDIGVWIQTGEVALLALSLFYYLHHVRGMRASLALLLLVPVASLRCLYMYNGGLADFRMDLSLAVMFATTAVWYLAATASTKWWHYLACGVCAGITCLFRATAPVYLVVALAPLCLIDLLAAAGRMRRLLGSAIAVVAASAVAGWFFVLNFDHLHYYYLVWNHDALARLPLSESWHHLWFACRHIGLPLLYFTLSLQAAVLAGWAWRYFVRRDTQFAWRPLLALDWRALWIGLSPAAFLMLKGAGLNSFVSMPSAFGLALFILLPLRQSTYASLGRWSFAAVSIVAAVILWAALAEGWKEHAGPATNAMAAHQQTLEAIVADAQRQHCDTPKYAVCHLFYVNTRSLHNVLLFDLPSQTDAQGLTRYKGVAPLAGKIEQGNDVEWNNVAGDSDTEKITTLVSMANKDLDYLVLPTEETAEFMQKFVAHHPTNRVGVELRRQMLASGNWEKVSDDLCNRPEEVVAVYRNSQRAMQR